MLTSSSPNDITTGMLYVNIIQSQRHQHLDVMIYVNRRFPEITGEDNLTVFSYSGRVKSPEWRRQRRRANLRQFQSFRDRPIIIYTRLPAGRTYYPICMFPTNSECLIGIYGAFFAFCLRVSVILPTCSLYPNKSEPTLRYTRRHGPIYTGHACRHLPSAVPWISEDRLLTLTATTSPWQCCNIHILLLLLLL